MCLLQGDWSLEKLMHLLQGTSIKSNKITPGKKTEWHPEPEA
jgi:hypothetical protein